MDPISTVKGFRHLLKGLSGLGTEKLRMGRTELAMTGGPIPGTVCTGTGERGGRRLPAHQKCLSFYFAAADLITELGFTAEN